MLPPDNDTEAFELINTLESYYSDAFDGFEEDAMFYEGLLDDFIEAPEGHPVTIPTTARAVVDEAVDNVDSPDVIVHYAPRKAKGRKEPGKEAEKSADKIRTWARDLVHYWRSSSADIDPIRDFEKNLFMSGRACFKVVPDWTLYPTLSASYEEKLRSEAVETQDLSGIDKAIEAIKRARKENCPITIRSLGPDCFMEDPTIGRKLFVIERYQSSPQEVANIFGDEAQEWFKVQYEVTVPIHEIWTASYIDFEGRAHQGKHWVYVAYEKKVEEDNPHGNLPYIIKYSSFGREAYESAPEKKAVGFFTRQNKSMFLAEMRRFTHFDAIMSQAAWPIAFIDERVGANQVTLTPGYINYVSEEVLQNLDKMWIAPKIPDAEYLSSLTTIGAQIERGTVQRALRGAGVPGTDSAAQYNSIASQAKMRIEPVKNATQDALGEAVSMALRYVDLELQDECSIPVGEDDASDSSISPDDIRGRYRCRIEFQPNEDAIRERKLLIASEAMTKGKLNPYDAYTFAGFDNVMEIIGRNWAYAALESPIVQRAMQKRVLAEWGEDIDQLELEVQFAEAEKQTLLKQFVDYLQIGTMRGAGDPSQPGGSPLGGTPPGPQAPGPLNAQGLEPVGAQAAVVPAPVQGAMSDIRAMQ